MEYVPAFYRQHNRYYITCFAGCSLIHLYFLITYCLIFVFVFIVIIINGKIIHCFTALKTRNVTSNYQ